MPWQVQIGGNVVGELVKPSGSTLSGELVQVAGADWIAGRFVPVRGFDLQHVQPGTPMTLLHPQPAHLGGNPQTFTTYYGYSWGEAEVFFADPALVTGVEGVEAVAACAESDAVALGVREAAVCADAAETGAGAAQGLSMSGKVVAGVGGAIQAVSGGIEIGFAIYHLVQGSPTAAACDAVSQRIDHLIKVYSSEPASTHRDAILSKLREVKGTTVVGLRKTITMHHNGVHGSKVASGAAGVAGGGFMVAAAFAGPAAPVLLGVGAVLGASSGVTSVSSSVADSCRGYEFRGQLIAIADTVIASQRKYAQKTGRLTHGITGTAGRCRFEGSASCQTYMTIEYSPAVGQGPLQIMSCDVPGTGWYQADVRLEPGARNVKVSFDVRGGGQVCAVHRDAPGMPWAHDANGGCYREVFTADSGDGLDARFVLAGSSFHRYVSSVHGMSPRTPTASVARAPIGHVQPGDRVYVKFKDTNLYLTDIPDYNGYAGAVGPEKQAFKFIVDKCYDACISGAAGARKRVFPTGTEGVQLRHLGDDKGRKHAMQDWRYYYHATTSSGKYDKHRPSNAKQFFLINGTDTSVEYGRPFKLYDMAYFGITCYRTNDPVDKALNPSSDGQYWLSAKYQHIIHKYHPMYYTELVFERAD